VTGAGKRKPQQQEIEPTMMREFESWPRATGISWASCQFEDNMERKLPLLEEEVNAVWNPRVPTGYAMDEELRLE